MRVFVSIYLHMIERTVTGLKGVHVPVRQNITINNIPG